MQYTCGHSHTHTHDTLKPAKLGTVSRKVHSAAGSLEPSVASPSPPKAVASCSCVPCHPAASSPSQHLPSNGPTPPLSRRPTRPTRNRSTMQRWLTAACRGGVPCHGANRARTPPRCPDHTPCRSQSSRPQSLITTINSVERKKCALAPSSTVLTVRNMNLEN